MDVLVLIDKLDDLVHNAKAVPLTDQVRIDREEIYDILDQMRATIPEEIKQARWIVKERQEMLAEAKRECDRLIGEAREQAMREASQTEIVKLAERQSQDIVEEARRDARETRLEMEDWADGILSTLEVNLDKFLGAVRRGRERLHERSQETVVAGIGPIDRDGLLRGRVPARRCDASLAPSRRDSACRAARPRAAPHEPASRARHASPLPTEGHLHQAGAGDAAERRIALAVRLDVELQVVPAAERGEVPLRRHRQRQPAVLTGALVLRVPRHERRRAKEDERVADDEPTRVLHLDPDGERRGPRSDRVGREDRLIDDETLDPRGHSSPGSTSRRSAA